MQRCLRITWLIIVGFLLATILLFKGHLPLSPDLFVTLHGIIAIALFIAAIVGFLASVVVAITLFKRYDKKLLIEAFITMVVSLAGWYVSMVLMNM